MERISLGENYSCFIPFCYGNIKVNSYIRQSGEKFYLHIATEYDSAESSEYFTRINITQPLSKALKYMKNNYHSGVIIDSIILNTSFDNIRFKYRFKSKYITTSPIISKTYKIGGGIGVPIAYYDEPNF